MPRRNRSNASAPNVTRVPFHQVVVATLSGVTGAISYPVNPQTTPFLGVSEVADQFDLFALKSLHYRIHPMDPTNTSVQTMSYYPEQDIQTLTTSQNSHMIQSAIQTAFCGVPSQWSRVPPSILKGMLDWYKCSPDSGAAEFENQGILLLCGGLSEVVTFEVRGEFHFKNPVDAALQVDRAIARAVSDGLVIRVPVAPIAPLAPVTPDGGKSHCIPQRLLGQQKPTGK